MSWFRWDGDDLILECHLQPAARSDDFAGLHGDRLKIRLTAPPVDGKANAELIELVARTFGRDDLVRNVTHLYGRSTRPSESVLDDCWSLIASNRGNRILHKLAAYVPERVTWRERWVAAMQQGDIPLRVIDGARDPISGAHMVARYRELIANADTVLLEQIGHYPQTEAPAEVLMHYLQFRDRLAGG